MPPSHRARELPWTRACACAAAVMAGCAPSSPPAVPPLVAAETAAAAPAPPPTATPPAPTPPAPPPPAPLPAGRHVVLVSIDGMRPDYYTHADTYGLKIPTLRGLMARGRYAEAVRGTWPTVTYPAHTTLVTGARPNAHGILANRPFDPTFKNQGGWNWYAESITADTLWAAARRAGKTSGSVYWPVTVGAAIDDNFPQYWRAKNQEDEKLLRALDTPGLADEYRHVYGDTLPAEQRTDHERGNAAEFLVRNKRHDLTLVYFTDLDDAQHAHGPGSREALATFERIDAELGRVVAAIDAAGDHDRTAVFVVSDHGFAKVEHVVRPGVLLRKEGLIDVAPDGSIRGWRAGTLAAGGLAAIYLKDPHDEAVRERVRALFESAARDPASGIAAVVDAAALAHEGGFQGASFSLTAAPGYEFDAAVTGRAVGPSGDRGAHGYPPNDPDMKASLIAAGAGIRSGRPLAEVPMTAIAPTIARILGITLKNAESPAIADLLLEP